MDWKKYRSHIHLNGEYLSGEEAMHYYGNTDQEWEKEIAICIKEWISEDEFMKVRTSGSTGMPKWIQLSKTTMIHSALFTGKYLNLKPGDSALLCLPTRFIGGKMMLVRAFVLGLHLDISEPKALIDMVKSYDFSAMTPHQLIRTLDHLGSRELQVSKLIIGGSAVGEELIKRIQMIRTQCYSSYGMTETSSHIALRKLNGSDQSDDFSLIDPSININTDDRGCLSIKAPYLGIGELYTNDVVEIRDATHFHWKGRVDHVINSGGIKLFPEELEKKLSGRLPFRYIMFGETDPIFQQRVAMLIETEKPVALSDLETVLRQQFHSTELPRSIYCTHKLAETENGKIDRNASLRDIKKIHSLQNLKA